MGTRRVRILQFNVSDDGTVDLPEESTIISIELDSKGPFGQGPIRPTSVWAEVPDDTPA